MNNDRRFRRLVFTAALLAILTYAIADKSWLIGGVALSLAMIGWRITERRGGRVVPRALIALAIVLAIGWAILSGLRDGLNVAHFCQFTIAVLVIKAFDRRTSADLGQFVMLSLFLAIGALLTSNSLWMFLTLLPTLAYGVAAGVAYQFHLGRVAARRSISQTRTGGAPARAGGSAAAAAPVRSRLAVALDSAPRIRGVARTLSVGWAAATAISLVVFVMFPRNIGADSFGRWGNAGVGMVTGFTNQVNLGEGGLISTSSVPVLDLTVRTLDGQSLGAPEETFYLRGAVLDTYQREGNRWRWTTSEPPRQDQPLTGGLGASLSGGAGSASQRGRGSLIELDIMIRNARSSDFYLFTVWRPRRIEFETAATIRYSNQTLIVLRSGQAGRVRYEVQCEPVEPSLRFAENARRTEVSFESAPIRDLASSILRTAGIEPDPALRPLQDDAAAAAAIERHFDTGFGYTLDIARVPNGRDPIEWFLFDERQGHCEYYASAMVALCRSVGINARIVTGFVATEFNEATSHYVVRESNAHAWVEFEAAPGQWLTRDPTPSGEFRRIHRPDPTLASRVRSIFEAINYAWITSVVAFDDTTRTSLVSAMRIDASALNDWADDASRRIRAGGGALLARALRNALVVSMSVALLGVFVVYAAPILRAHLRPRLLALWLRLRARSLGVRRGVPPDVGFYRRLLAALARLGHEKPDWRPPLAHTAMLENEAVGAPASRLARAFYRVRFGNAALSPQDRAAVDADLAALERARG